MPSAVHDFAEPPNNGLSHFAYFDLLGGEVDRCLGTIAL